MQILLMNNSIADAEVLRAMLMKAPGQPCTIRQVDTLAEGLAQLRKDHYDVTLMSLALIDGNGLAGVLAVREQVPDLGIILLIAADQEEIALQALDLGVQDYLIGSEISRSLLSRAICGAMQRTRLAKELKESEERFRATFDRAAIGIAQVAPDGSILRINQKYCQIVGYSQNEMQGLTFIDITHKDDRDMSLQHFQRLIKGEVASYTLEKRFIRKDGVAIWAKLNASLVFDSSGQPKFSIGFVEDITPRKQAQEALRYSEARFEALFRDNPVMIVSLDEQFTMRMVNPKCASNLGYGIEELEGQSVLKLFYEDDRQGVIDQLHKCLQNPYEVYSWQLRKKRKNGDMLWVEEVAQAVRGVDGTLTVLVVCQDITDRKNAENALQQAHIDLERSNRELEQFAYVASHDLKEPLRMVSSFMQLLNQKYQGRLDEKGAAYIRYAIDGARRMEHLIEGVLNYSKIKATSFGWVDLNTTLQDVMANLAAIIRESHAELVAGRLPTVWGDGTLLLQLFQNLIGNALKYSKKDVPPRILVSSEDLQQEWLFSLRDNGIGIPEGQFEKIFQIFQRLHTSEEYAGAGIGLASCKKIVEQHHGRIWLESTPGTGTTFFCTIGYPGQQKHQQEPV